MNNRAKTAGFVLGLVGGILNGIEAILTLIAIIRIVGYAPAFIISILSAITLACILNLVGGCVCRNKRTAGGIMMLISAGLLFVYLIYKIAVSEAQYFEGGIVEVVIWLIAEVISIAGAIVCLSGPGAPALPYGQPYAQPYGQPPYDQPYGQPYQQPQQPYGQPYQQQPQVQPHYPQQPNKTEE